MQQIAQQSSVVIYFSAILYANEGFYYLFNRNFFSGDWLLIPKLGARESME